MTKSRQTHKWIATFFLAIFLPTLVPINELYAASNGPNAPEAASFEPVDASDMVSLATGDMAYVLPLLNVPSPEGGYPISLSYHGGIGYEQEASMVGLGWNLNPGAVNRSVNGSPDDWKDANVRDISHFSQWSKSVDLSVGCAIADVSLGYSWDSNGTKKGTIGVGVGYEVGEVSLRAGIGLGYSNKTGTSGYMTTSVGTNGFGVGTYADTDGFMSVGIGHSIGFGSGNVGSSMSTVGFSLTSDRGSVGVGVSAAGSSILNNNSGSSSKSSFGVSVGIYLYGFFVKLGYNESSFSRDKLDDDYVYGPLYYSSMPQNEQGSDNTYPGSLLKEHKRDKYMDTYKQSVPEVISSAVSPNNALNDQKPAYIVPAYDSYEVNAQGLSGIMSPRLLENKLLITPGADIEYAENILQLNACAFETCGNDYMPTACPGHPLYAPVSQQMGTKINTKKMYVNSHYSTLPDRKFVNTFGNSGNAYFYFDHQFPSNLTVNPVALTPTLSAVNFENYFNINGANSVPSRAENSDYIEMFTNGDITANPSNFLEAKGYNRQQDKGYLSEGIGGYKITTTDGKTYHYSRPVYQFEQIYRQLSPRDGESEDETKSYREVRKTRPYATHWLLTAITGPDYVKNTSNPYPDQGDYGYWVRFDYGKWTDGYAWRTPSTGYENVSPFGDNSKAEQYAWGRKQLIYLDKVVTRTHTALFVKSLRNDDVGAYIGQNGYPSYEGDEGLRYPSQKTLKLDEIILLKNRDYDSTPVEPYTQNSTLISGPISNTAYWQSPQAHVVTYDMNQQLQVIDKNDFVVDANTGKYQIYSKAEKIIKLNQSYDLAKNTPNSIAPLTQGRLTLEEVETLTTGGESYMPPYKFEYIGKTTPYTAILNGIPQKDNWGYNVNNASLWTLNKIHTPTGGSIEFEYEADQYYSEAYARRLFDEDNLMFKMYVDGDGSYVLEYRQHSWYSEPGPGETSIDFTKYFSPNDMTWGSIWCCHDHNNGNDNDWISLSPRPFSIKSVTPYSVILYVPPLTPEELEPVFEDVTDNSEFRGKGFGLCNVTDECGHGNHTTYNFNFKLMANKTPESGFGGGIRVKSIASVDESNNRYKTEYNYNDPVKGRTSGITSYAPIKGKKYIAYKTEIPGPRVMYEYVSVTDRGLNNEVLGKTQYQFDVLHPDFNVFDANLREGNHFRSTVSINNALDVNKSTIGVNVKLEDNFATLGSVIKVLQINKVGQVMSQTRNSYLSLDQLADNITEKPGKLQESFHSMTSIYNHDRTWMSGNGDFGVYNWDAKCEGPQSFTVNKRFATTSSKITYPQVQKRKEVIVGNNKQITEYKTIDLKTGFFLETQTTLADGTIINSKSVPAYTKYSEMGSKVGSNNANKKHMLTQEAMNVTTVNKGGVWKTLNANITTWNKSWSYRDNLGVEDSNSTDVWRKHKNFVWKEHLDPDGNYTTPISENNSHFNWATGLPTVTDTWQKVNEITRYNHFSAPLEVKDINNNFASSKMADNNTKTIVSGNARYTEMYYTGAEYVAQGNYFEGEVQGADFRTDEVAHTGRYSVKVTSPSDHIFEINGQSGGTDYYTNSNNYNAALRPGIYKVSLWGLDERSPTKNIKLMLNETSVPVAETIKAGCWIQFNFYVTIPANTTNSLYVKNTEAGENWAYYFDDFRMHPISSSISSYVYDLVTDELSFTLDGNNMGTGYKYDNAGRLLATYVETEDDITLPLPGGFKIVAQNKLNYKNFQSSNVTLPSTITNCLIPDNVLTLEINDDFISTFENKFKTTVGGGSGNFAYQYSWLTDNENQTFTNFTIGGKYQSIPYAFVDCGDREFFNKKWSFKVKVTDLNSNLFTEGTYEYNTTNCQFTTLDHFADIQVSKMNSLCGTDKYSFTMYPKDNMEVGNYKYEYAYYDSQLSFDDQTFINVSNTNGKFCPNWYRATDTNCTGEEYRDFVSLAYRVTNTVTNEVSKNIILFIGECSEEDSPYTIHTLSQLGRDHMENGTLIIMSDRGEVEQIYDVNKVVK